MPPKSVKHVGVPAHHPEYRELINRIGVSIEEGRRLAARRINSILVATYWCVGHWMVKFEQSGQERAGYGEGLLAKLSADLTKKFGHGWSVNHLQNIRQFYLTHPNFEKYYTVCSIFKSNEADLDLKKFSEHFLLAWSSYRLLMRLESPEKKTFYEYEALKGDWSSRQLDRQIQSMLYERTALSKRKESVIEKAHKNPITIKPEDEIKDPYVLDFLGLKDEYSESELEDALIHHLERFLLELGVGFTFAARQKRFMVGGNHYRIDLLLYHRVLRCLVLIDLKIGDFTHADAGQMNFYLNWAKHEAKLEGENDPVGIVLCSGKDRSYVQYALGGMANKIFVSKYQINLPRLEDLRHEIDQTKKQFLSRVTHSKEVASLCRRKPTKGE